MTDPIFILRGIAGSTAHGLATPESDIDTHGVFAWPTDSSWSLFSRAESIVKIDPDESYHELQKFLGLAIKANPSILDTLWLDEYLEKEFVWGDHLISIRSSFLSARNVRSAYLGYANDQFKKLEASDRRSQDLARQDPIFESSTKNRTRKHAKHLIRLLEQGLKLYTTGDMSIKVEDPEKYHAILTEWPLAEVASFAVEQMKAFEDATSVLPEVIDIPTINRFLYDYRSAH